jgi:hypothetical protein
MRRKHNQQNPNESDNQPADPEEHEAEGHAEGDGYDHDLPGFAVSPARNAMILRIRAGMTWVRLQLSQHRPLLTGSALFPWPSIGPWQIEHFRAVWLVIIPPASGRWRFHNFA